MSTKAIIHVTGRLLGINKAGASGSITGAGWAKYDANGTAVYKNRMIYGVYDKSQENNELNQVVEIVGFGKRFEWIGENLSAKTLVSISGSLTMKPTVYDGKAYANASIEVLNIDFMSSPNNNGAAKPAAPATATTAQASAAQQAPSQPQEELPF